MASPYQQNQQRQQAPPPNNQRPSRNQFESDFAEQEASQIEIVTGTALQAIEGAQSLAQVETAHRYPRRSVDAIRRELNEWVTIDEETATECFYSLRERSGTEDKPIEGPSARFAEIVMAAYGNMRAGAQTVGNDGKRITAMGIAWDLQRNNAVQISADRSISRRDGRTYSMDMQVTTAMAANSIAFRNAVLKAVPPLYWKPAFLAAKKKAAGEGPIETRFQDSVKAFRVWGVTEAMLLTYLEVPTEGELKDKLKDEHITELRGLFTSLRDGQVTVQDAFKGINRDGSTTTPQPPDPSKPPTPQGQQAQAPDDQGKQAPQAKQTDSTKPVDTPPSAAGQRPTAQQEQKPGKGSDDTRSGKTRTASSQATPSTGTGLFGADAPDTSPKGPFSKEDFEEEEYMRLFTIFSAVGRGQRTHFNAYLSDWSGTKNQLVAEIEGWRRV